MQNENSYLPACTGKLMTERALRWAITKSCKMGANGTGSNFSMGCKLFRCECHNSGDLIQDHLDHYRYHNVPFR